MSEQIHLLRVGNFSNPVPLAPLPPPRLGVARVIRGDRGHSGAGCYSQGDLDGDLDGDCSRSCAASSSISATCCVAPADQYFVFVGLI